MTISTVIAGLIFGSIGFAAFIYGKKQASWKPMIIGVALIGYPYFVRKNIWVYIVGFVLIILLFVFRD